MKVRLALIRAFICAAIALSSVPAHSVQAVAAPAWIALNTAAFSSETLLDIAVSPNYTQDKTIFALTFGSQHNLWLTQDGANIWQKVYTSASGVVIDSVALSPDYGKTAQVVYLLGSFDGNPRLWRSPDAGTNWSLRIAPDGTGLSSPLAVASDTVLFLSGFDSIHNQAYIYYSANGGMFFTSGVSVGSLPFYSMILSPSYTQDRTLLIGNTNGGVLWSNDGGSSFRLVSSVSLTGIMRVAFDENFAVTRTVYAVSNAAGGGIYSTKVGVGQPWQRLDTSFPSDEILGSLVVSTTGVLYAASSRPVNAPVSLGGLLRCLNPVSPASFERVTVGLSDGASLWEGSLRCVGNQLWAIDSTNNLLVTFVDSLIQPVNLIAPANNALGTGVLSGNSVNGILLNWLPLGGATTYQWQLSSTSNFSLIPAGFSANTSGTNVSAPSLFPVSIYFWRVRVIAPLYSPWSAVWSFSTPSPPAEIGSPQLGAPLTANIGLEPSFEWSEVDGATGYELVVSKISDFSNPVISKTGAQSLAVNSWKSRVILDYSTHYFWRVRAITAAVAGPWSTTGIFSTLDEPQVVPTVTVISTIPPPAPSQTVTVSSPAASQTVATISSPTMTGSPPVVPQISAETPDWVYYALAGGAAGVVLLSAIILLARSRKKPIL